MDLEELKESLLALHAAPNSWTLRCARSHRRSVQLAAAGKARRSDTLAPLRYFTTISENLAAVSQLLARSLEAGARLDARLETLDKMQARTHEKLKRLN